MDELLKRMVARVNSCAFIGDLDAVVPPKKERRRPKLQKALLALTAPQRDMLVQLLEGSYTLVEYRRERFAVRREGASYGVVGLYEGEGKHVVEGDRCSCPDARFRDRACKHVLVARKYNAQIAES